MKNNFENAAHLWRRAGFGATTQQIHETVDRGIDRVIDELLDFDREDSDLENALEIVSADTFDLNNNIEDVRAWWIYRLLHSKNPLREKLALFWHGHFATSAAKVDRASLMLQQIRTLRSLAAAPFRDILDAIAKDPAMLIWLDGNNNKKGKPNENFARELFELFSLGIGNYTEKDIQESARAFTGWGLADYNYRFDAKQHDSGEKSVFGARGNWDGGDILDAILVHPATPRFIATKLCRFFINDQPDAACIERVAEAFRRSRGHMHTTITAVFRDPAFFADENRRSIVKSPVDFVISSARVAGVRIPIRNYSAPMRRMGQSLLAPPSVKGWDGGAAWLSSAAVFERLNFALQIAGLRGAAGEPRFNPKTWLAGRSFETVGELVDAIAFDILHMQPSPATRAALVEYISPAKTEKKAGAPMAGAMDATKAQEAVAAAKFKLDGATLDTKVRGALRLLLSSPEFQLS